MKPCSKNREGLVVLALGSLEPRRAEELRAHLECCEGCRGYFEEIAHLKERLAAPGAPVTIHTSERFHHRVVRALAAEERRAPWNRMFAPVRWGAPGASLRWRLAWGVALVMAAGLAILMATRGARWHHEQVAPPILAQTPPAATPQAELQPSLANYQRSADQSPDALDELLDRQVKALSGGGGAVYTAQVSVFTLEANRISPSAE